MTTITIAPKKKIRKQVLDIAGGRSSPEFHDHLLWFTSLSSIEKILDDENLNLLRLIRRRHPESYEQLASFSGTNCDNVAKRLDQLAQYGLVALFFEAGQFKPVLTSDWLQIEVQ